MIADVVHIPWFHCVIEQQLCVRFLGYWWVIQSIYCSVVITQGSCRQQTYNSYTFSSSAMIYSCTNVKFTCTLICEHYFYNKYKIGWTAIIQNRNKRVLGRHCIVSSRILWITAYWGLSGANFWKDWIPILVTLEPPHYCVTCICFTQWWPNNGNTMSFTHEQTCLDCRNLH